MFERFTQRARKVLVLAQDESRRLRHPVIDSTHLLLGLLAETGGIAALALERCGVSSTEVRRHAAAAGAPGTAAPAAHIPFTPHAKNVLTHAFEDSLSRRVGYIGTESLLLGLLREDCSGRRVLQALVPGGVDQVRVVTMAVIEQRAGTLEAAQEALRASLRARLGGLPRPPRLGARLRGYLSRPRAAEPVPIEYRGLIRSPRRPDDPVAPRPELTDLLLGALGRGEHNNVLLVGVSGAGKSALVRWTRQTLADREFRLGALTGATVVELGRSALRLGPSRLIQHQQPLIVVIEDLDAWFAAVSGDGGARVPALLGELAESATPMLVTATPDAHARLLAADPALAERFAVLPVPAADAALSAEILRLLRPELARYHGVAIPDETLAAAVALGAAGSGGRVLPGAAVDLLDAAAARVALAATASPAPALRPEDLAAEPETA